MVTVVKSLTDVQKNLLQVAADMTGAQLDAAAVVAKSKLGIDPKSLSDEMQIEIAKIIASNHAVLAHVSSMPKAK